ncbi:MAG TPA: hypothetical protein H9867_05195 [Candidatus Corynebacterium gallistercoris]|uniref:Secreted protein n=1 Tax=Candidatus Corynebacterium gallistercoris TaxID=2838530 RepID=A0A9D1URA7_9CORY|nr:hypothetical protein [Candidatus Corynebacterium gallistercoris]
MRRSRHSRAARGTRSLAALSAAALLTTPVMSAPDAHAQAPLGSFPASPTDTPNAWANPLARSTDPQQAVDLDVVSTDPATSPVTGGHITYTLKVTNNRLTPISDLSLRLYTDSALATSAAVRISQLSNLGEYSTASELLTIPGTIDPGQTTEVTVAVTWEGEPPAGVHSLQLPPGALASPGAYPLLFSLSGSPEDQAASQLLSVTRASVVRGVASPEKEENQVPLTLIYPLAAQTNITPGATGDAPQQPSLFVSNEDLAGQLAPGGRLRGLLDAYIAATARPGGDELRQATCIAIDPELLEAVTRMSGGYQVGTKVPDAVKEQKRLRDSWGDLFGRGEPKSTPGQGAEAASQWLADLRKVVENNCSVALPYAGADVNALAEVVGSSGIEGDATAAAQWLAIQAMGTGAATLERVLGQVPTKNVVIPDSGYVTEQALPLLAAAGADQEVGSSSSAWFEAVADGTRPVLPAASDAAPVTVLVSDNTVRVDEAATQGEEDADGGAEAGAAPARTVEVADNTHALPFAGDLGAALKGTGTNPDIAGYANPDWRFELEEDSPATRMSAATAVLDRQIDAGEAVLAVPPAVWSVDEVGATGFLETVTGYLTRDEARAEPLSALTAAGRESDRGGVVETYQDVGETSEAFAGAVARAAADVWDLTGLMRNDPHIAVTREAYTRPLFADLLRASSNYSMRQRPAYTATRQSAIARVETVTSVVGNLRRSISLLPPGNVFTRTSDSSPLLVVARNGLPLPVPAKVDYSSDAPATTTIHLPEGVQVIPAKGSITLSLTTDMADESRSETTSLSLWLADPKNTQRISDSVDLRVQSVPGISATGAALVLGGLVLIAGVGKVLWSRRNQAKCRPKLTHLSS